jgi:EmrB/QacA subfamily drug resistance transporter
VSSSSPSRGTGAVLALLAMTQFLVVVDASIVNVALPSVARSLDISQQDITWVVNAYTLTFGGFLLLGGRLADLLGRRRMFIAGVALFALASLAGGLAESFGWLVSARAAQGLGAALASPAALSIITTTFAEGPERNRALGIWGAVAGAGGAAGVLLGGVLTEYLGWEWVLFVNVPVGLAVAALAPRVLPESRDAGRERVFDVPGAVLSTGGLALGVYTLVDAERVGWLSARTLVLGGVALALLIAFVVLESRSRHPLMPLGIFRLGTLRGANVSGLLIGVSLFSMFFFISLYLQQVLGYDALKAGLAYLPLALSIVVSAGAASALVTRLGFKPVLMGGLALVAVGLAWFSQVSPDGSFLPDVLGPSIIVGAGLGFSFVPVTIAAVVGTQPEEAGLASGLINTAQQVGGALGLAVLASVASSVTAGSGSGDPLTALTDGFSTAFLAAAGIAALAFVLAALLISTADSRAMADSDAPVAMAG